VLLSKHSKPRKSRRHPMRRAAQVLLGPQNRPVQCVIWDISEGGGRLAIAYATVDLPRNFTLLLSKDGSVKRDCEVVWVDSRFTGVKFV
jgi:PilZ domain-containing protein